MMAIGVAGSPSASGFGGLRLVFTGRCTVSAASAERPKAPKSRGPQVADVMTPDRVTIAPSASAAESLEPQRRTGHSVYR
jgi:hypothetical protein